MASRIIHIIIAEEIVKNIQVNNRKEFILGSLAPDLITEHKNSYKDSHFYERLTKPKLKGINWAKFISSYHNLLKDSDFLKGYLTHLVSDAVWIKHMLYKYVRCYPQSEWQAYQQKSYLDMRTSNTVLAKKHKLKNYYTFSKQDFAYKVIGTSYGNIRSLNDYLKQDFTLKGTENKLHVFSYESFEYFIEESIKMCKYIFSKLDKNVDFNVKQFYVSYD